MKKIQLFAALLMVILVMSCGKKKESKDIIVPTAEVVKPKAPIRMQPYDQRQEVEWLEKNYQVIIRRKTQIQSGSNIINNVRSRTIREHIQNTIGKNATITKENPDNGF